MYLRQLYSGHADWTGFGQKTVPPDMDSGSYYTSPLVEHSISILRQIITHCDYCQADN